MMDLIAKGAEANLYRDGGELVKERVRKEYRIPELDERIRKLRTRREAKLLEKISSFGFPAPKVLSVSEKEKKFTMEFVDGERLKELIEGGGKVKELGKLIGGELALLHENNVVHNDLTTSNMLLSEGKLFMIDWGLGYHTTRLEDKAMDLVVLKKSLMATHPLQFEELWTAILAGYKPAKEMSARVEKILSRVRYH